MKARLIICTMLLAAANTFADAADDVRCREIRFSQSVEEKDLARFASFIDTDARFVTGDISRGPQAIATAWGVFFTDDGPRIKWRPQIVEVLADGTLALSRGPYRMITTDEDGVATEHWGTFNSIWRLQHDGAWKVVFDAGSPAAAEPADDVKALLDQDDDCVL